MWESIETIAQVVLYHRGFPQKGAYDEKEHTAHQNFNVL